jgi:hypothetical protein
MASLSLTESAYDACVVSRKWDAKASVCSVCAGSAGDFRLRQGQKQEHLTVLCFAFSDRGRHHRPQCGFVVRKGNGHQVDETIPDARQNNRAGVINPADNGVSMGAQHGPQPDLSGEPSAGSNQGIPHPQTEIGEADDSFVVYKGGGERPLDAPPAWRYMARDGLSPHDVPAVAAFRKAVADADKAAAKNP